MSDAVRNPSRRGVIARLGAAALGLLWLGRARAARASTEATYFIGEIRMYAGYYPPAGWMFCEGQLLSMEEHAHLHAILGTTYGGDGVTTFALPDFRGRAPMHMGSGPGLPARALGEYAGEEYVSLSPLEIPAHSHTVKASSGVGTTDNPSLRYPAKNAAGVPSYHASADTALANNALVVAGSSQPHTNLQPFTCVNFIISLYGTFPPS